MIKRTMIGKLSILNTWTETAKATKAPTSNIMFTI
jgi:hypothetical protein